MKQTAGDSREDLQMLIHRICCAFHRKWKLSISIRFKYIHIIYNIVSRSTLLFYKNNIFLPMLDVLNI